jgi:hypothetical protein
VHAESDGLAWNETILRTDDGPSAHLWKAMRERLIGAIAFGPDIDQEELTRLLVLLSREPQELAALGGAGRVFGQTGRCIRVVDVDFSQKLLELEAKLLEGCTGLAGPELAAVIQLCEFCWQILAGRGLEALWGDEEDQGGGGATSSTSGQDAMETVAARVEWLIQHAGEAAALSPDDGWEEWRAEFVRHWSELSPTWRGAIIRTRRDTTAGRPDVLKAVAQELPPAECVPLVLEYPGAIRSEPSLGLSVALSRIMGDQQRRDTTDALLREEALRRGISREVYDNVVGTLIAEMESQRDGVPGLPVVGSAPEDGHPEHTHGPEEWLAISHEAVEQARLWMLLELASADLEEVRYQNVVDALVQEARRLAEREEGDTLIEVLKSLREAAHRQGESETGRSAMAEHALVSTGSSGAVHALVSRATQVSGREEADLIDLIAHLGDKGLETLADMACQSGPGRTEALARAIAGRGARAEKWLRRLLRAVRRDAVSRLVQVLSSSQDADAARHLLVLAAHQSPGVRMELVRTIVRRGMRAASQVLLTLAEDEETEVALAAVRGLAELRVRDAAPGLCDLAAQQRSSGGSAEMQLAIVAALSAAGGEAAVEGLARILSRGGFMSWLTGSRSQVSAAEALENIGGATAREALQRGLRTRHRAVRDACRRALATMGDEPSAGGNGR